jgi:hypothetical protein
MKESLKVLQECADLQLKKANDYQNPNSNIKQADYYPRGVSSLLDIVHAKTLRMMSVVEAMENDPEYSPNFESLEDSAKDLINYGSFIAAYIRGGIDGQEEDRDFLNRKVEVKSNKGTWDSFPDSIPPMYWAEENQPEIHVSGVPYKVKSYNFKNIETDPTYAGGNYWLRNTKPKDAK